jgi:hypothetical protein
MNQSSGDGLRGFIVRDNGISWEELLRWAATCANLQRVPPMTRPNPFKPGELMTLHSHGFAIVSPTQQIGRLWWEASECIGVAGSDPQVDQLVADLCKSLGARFEKEEDE